MKVIHIDKNGEVIKDINGIVIRLPDFYRVLESIQRKGVHKK